MEISPKPKNQQDQQKDEESYQELTTAICSPEFPNGCTDVESDESEQ